mgnify:CR=1 FL=1
MPLIRLEHIEKSYLDGKKKVRVLEDIFFSVYDNDFICVVGPSGCGKSTLLKLIMGIEEPTKGKIIFNETRRWRISMVFQTFSLLPWLTVFENVNLALEPYNLSRAAQHRIVKKYIDVVGLTGFENAYPRQLSSGMKQRVGIARALVIEPTVICMDEPFSALDPLSAEALRRELINLWEDPQLPPQAVIMVTHNIEEAIYLADRIIVLSHQPAKVIANLKIDLPRPRNKKSPEFYEILDNIYSLMM